MTLIEDVQTSRDFTVSYDVLAAAYDAFTGEGDYAGWAAGLLEEVRRHGVPGARALEIGCGTGRTTVALVEGGFHVTACDPCAAMLDRARCRLGACAELEVGALPALPPGPPADLVAALNDVMNYVPPQTLRSAIAAMAARTVPGGIVLFDVNTRTTYEHGFAAATFVRRADGRFFVCEPVADTAPDAYAFDLHVFTPTGSDTDTCTHVVSSHRQWHHPHAAVVSALEATGLQLLETLGQHDDGRRDPHFDEAAHTKRVYLARRR